jgi:hypothetical protein
MTDEKREAAAEAIRQRIAELRARGAPFAAIEAAHCELFQLHMEARP